MRHLDFVFAMLIGSSGMAADVLVVAYDFRLGDWQFIAVPLFTVPFRCLYSKNVENLMMAGKHISVTHIAGSATKTMLNGGQTGVAAAL